MKKYLAEAIATFILVFVGTGSVVVDQVSGRKGDACRHLFGLGPGGDGDDLRRWRYVEGTCADPAVTFSFLAGPPKLPAWIDSCPTSPAK